MKNKKNNKKSKGFTLIELLVVIAIIAILAVVVVLTLNPAELLRQARDSNRISDFATIKSAITLYQEDVSTTTALCSSTSTTCANDLYLSGTTSTPVIATTSFDATTTGAWGFAGVEGAVVTSTSRLVTGTGWIPINLTAISSGAPISSWPVDPINTGSNFYIYAATSSGAGAWKIATKTESAKYGWNGPNDIITGDAGNGTGTYQQGSNLTGL